MAETKICSMVQNISTIYILMQPPVQKYRISFIARFIMICHQTNFSSGHTLLVPVAARGLVSNVNYVTILATYHLIEQYIDVITGVTVIATNNQYFMYVRTLVRQILTSPACCLMSQLCSMELT